MKTTGQQLVEACRAHGGSDAELGAAIDQALEEEFTAQLRSFLEMSETGKRPAICSWCGFASENAPESLRAHLDVCERHPLRIERDALREQLAARKATP